MVSHRYPDTEANEYGYHTIVFPGGTSTIWDRELAESRGVVFPPPTFELGDKVILKGFDGPFDRFVVIGIDQGDIFLRKVGSVQRASRWVPASDYEKVD